MALDPFLQLLTEGGQVEEVVLRLAKFHRRVAAALVRIDEVGRVELVAAVVALVAPRFGESTDRTLAFDVTIGQRAPAHRIEGAELLLRDQVPLLVQLEEQVLRDPVMVARGGAGEDVVGHPQPAKVLDDQSVVAVDELAWRNALLVGLVRDRRAVLVRTAGHQHARTPQAFETREHIGGHGEAGPTPGFAGAGGGRARPRAAGGYPFKRPPATRVTSPPPGGPARCA